jgi:hypothetical protein
MTVKIEDIRDRIVSLEEDDAIEASVADLQDGLRDVTAKVERLERIQAATATTIGTVQ